MIEKNGENAMSCNTLLDRVGAVIGIDRGNPGSTEGKRVFEASPGPGAQSAAIGKVIFRSRSTMSFKGGVNGHFWHDESICYSSI